MTRLIDNMKELGSTFFTGGNIDVLEKIASENIYVCGFADNRIIDGINQARTYWEERPFDKYAGCTLNFGKEKMISDNVAVLEFDLKYHGKEIGYRATGVSEKSNSDLRIITVHISKREPVKIKELIELDDVVNHVPAGVCLYRWDGKRMEPIVISDYYSNLMGMDGKKLMEEASGIDYEFVHPDDLAGLQKFLLENLNEPKKNLTYKYRIWNERKKEYVFFLVSADTVRQEDGSMLIYMASADITNEMKLQDELRIFNDKFENLLKNTDCGIAIYRWTKTVPFSVQYLNDRFCGMCGASREELFKQCSNGYVACVAEESKDEVMEAYRHAVKTMEPVEVTYRTINHEETELWTTLRMKAIQVDADTIDIYATYFDVTESIYAHKALEQSREIMENACEFAGMWTFTYDYDNGVAYTNSNLQEEYGFPAEVKNFPEVVFDYGFILPEYKELYCNSFEKLKRKEKIADFEIQAKLTDGGIHWLRFRCARLSGKDNMAVCSAQIIDAEKAMEARMVLERQKLADGSSLLLGYAVSNVSRNKMVEHHMMENYFRINGQNDVPDKKQIESSFLYSEDEKIFTKMHQPEYLLDCFQKGDTSLEFEYRIRLLNGEIIWVKNTMNLLADPKTHDVYLYEYCYDIHETKVLEEVMNAVVKFGFERCDSLMLDTDQVTILNSADSGNLHGITVKKYSEAFLQYANTILPEDRENYLRECSIEGVKEHLKNDDHYEVLHRVMENGLVHYKKLECFAYTQDKNICLLISTDVTELIKQEESKRQKLQESLEAAEQATMAKSAFLSRMSHEIRTPMNAIMGMISIARDNKTDFQQVFECLEKIDTSSHFLLNLINDILEMSRIESGNIEISNSVFDYNILMDNIRTIIEPLVLDREINYQFVNESRADSGQYTHQCCKIYWHWGTNTIYIKNRKRRQRKNFLSFYNRRYRYWHEPGIYGAYV
ncbi:MAG: histidine kinase dimerization/phospho-acceptor domain-containing protein [Lachnospiraceae bacterium]|nr:histidine kinase dimerization/phospho-acceptor domain-containing protein [Lachnospiraceae bacterium]MDD3615791.1 histidine kinase dimerization/phospho-acceptor domain-containing protein [Lachnospiraceae bacterium]